VGVTTADGLTGVKVVAMVGSSDVCASLSAFVHGVDCMTMVLILMASLRPRSLALRCSHGLLLTLAGTFGKP